MSKFLTTKEFIERAQSKFGNLYDYSKTIYVSSKDIVTITCKKHGEFNKRADKHLLGEGCPKCSRKTPTNDEFINKCKIIHENVYSYDKTIYKNSRSKIIITCSIHGDFEQVADAHITGCGCPKCGNSKKGVLLSLEYYLEQAKEIHNNKYDYSKIVFITSKKPVIIICPIHGEFEQSLQTHVNSRHGCPICGKEKSIFSTKTTEQFIIDANKIHKNLYNYDYVEYTHSFNKVKIQCLKHGIFEQLPSNHLSGNGCPICNYSKGELLIHNWLKENNIPFKPQFELITDEIARNSNLMIIDFFVKYKQQYFIEYDGIQHFEFNSFFHKGGIIDFEKQQRRDKVLNEFCELHKDKVTLIRFKYDESNEEIINKLNEIINGRKINFE